MVELTFCIPLSNGHVQRCFSQLKITKTNRRVGLGEDRLDQIVRIRIEGPTLEKWEPTNAVKLWWTDKTRRVHASHSAPRKHKDKSQSQGDEEFDWSLSDSENWLESDSDSEKESENGSDLL